MAIGTKDVRAVAEDIVRQAKLEQEKKSGAQKAQLERKAADAKEEHASRSTGPVIGGMVPFLDYNEEHTASDWRVMERLGISRRIYGKLPRALMDQLKEVEASRTSSEEKTGRVGQDSPDEKTGHRINGQSRLLGGLKKFFRMVLADDIEPSQLKIPNTVATPQPRALNIGINLQLKCSETEQASGFKNPTRAIFVVFVHPLVTDMHAVQDLAREMVIMIRNKQSRYIRNICNCEDLPETRPGSWKQQVPAKVESSGNFRIINIENYNRLANDELRAMNKPRQKSRWFRRQPPQEISMSDSRKEVFETVLADTKARDYFILIDRVVPGLVEKKNMANQYHSQLIGKTDRRVRTAYINCNGGRFTHCILRSYRLITNEEQWAMEAEIQRLDRMDARETEAQAKKGKEAEMDKRG